MKDKLNIINSISRKTSLKQVGFFVSFAFAFVLVSFLTRSYYTELATIMDSGGFIGIITFIILTAVFVIFVIPLDLVFLIPIGSTVWGPVPTAFMSITGWALGSTVAFGIARFYGISVVKKLIGFERIHAVEKQVPRHNLFFTVIALRMLVSVDILSYALGIFSTISWSQYILATIIGVIPFGFYFAYAGTLPFWYQIIAISFALVLASTIVLRYKIIREP